MTESERSNAHLLEEIERLRTENSKLRDELDAERCSSNMDKLPMSLDEFKRYGRQMIVDETEGLKGQLKLKNSSVLVVGAGGLGCPSLPYLAGAGIGKIGIVDNDIVDTSNLHRQVLHDSTKVGMFKCESAKQVLNKLNPHVSVTTYPVRLSNANAFDIFEDYDVILDCTDTPMARYLISDVAVNLGKPVVSASALRTEGQLSIFNFANSGPCYRCFYPTPPAPTSVSSCQEGGVLGPCVGLVGVAMVVETLKLLLGVYTIENFKPFLLQYSGFPDQTLRKFKMRGRREDCPASGSNKTVTRKAIESGEIDYHSFCGSRNYNVLKEDDRITVKKFEEEYRNSSNNKPYFLLDVRPSLHYSISHLPDTHNITVNELRDLQPELEELQTKIPHISKDSEVLVICRYGNDSQLATQLLKDKFKLKDVRDIKGGFFKYIDEINPSLPKY
ncbi:unnamed protein product [Kluyveromyces dobzhanskii CBS 2104]|uniref:Needs CLA4 to survive protein 3 n=1 Tax=Kluyveromyces dobzhanskii CBS 2104 TaxID=1427455 RepID=A0A0A8LAB2_9SACH|nr:unnamed protein product [Kluyveromyces dobzhanskii CBS 2104]